MFLTILAAVLLVFSFPFTAISLGFKTLQATNKQRLRGLKRKKARTKGKNVLTKIKSKLHLGNKKSSAKSKKEKKLDDKIKVTKASNIALKTSQIGMKAVATLLRGMSSVCSILAPIELFLAILILVILLVSAIACVLLVNNNYVNLNNTKSNNSFSSGGNQSNQQITIEGDNSTWGNAYTTMWKWYCANINTYQHGKYLVFDNRDGFTACTVGYDKGDLTCDGTTDGGVGCHGRRHGYACNLLDNTLVADDCSAYVGACIDYLGLNYSSNASMNMGTDNIETYLGDSFELLTSSSPNFEAKVGDILVYSGHTEILAHIENNQFFVYSWGRVPDCVINNTEPTWSSRGNLSDMFNSNNGMKEPVLKIYRYKGGS